VTRLAIRLPVLALCLLLTAAAKHGDTPAPGITCRSYIIYDMNVRRIVAAYEPTRRQPIASLTKLMTAIMACEQMRFDGRYTLNAAERKTFGGDSLRTSKLLELMLVPSNNAACRVVARVIGGGEAEFAKLMNQRARELGMLDTKFVNASGLPGAGQYSTALDVLRLALNALRYDPIRDSIVKHSAECGGRGYKAPPTALYDRLPGLRGGKTGYTRAAGRCLVLYYHADGQRSGDYVIVTLGSSGIKESFDDAVKVLRHHGLVSGVDAWQQ
jgi:serine-type D-Ala-D-Ala carboxypeptidase (penicillin-binding protein 5/6)